MATVHRPTADSDLYRILVESVLDYAIFALDVTGHVATWNKGAKRLKGYSASEIVGKHFSIFYPEEDKQSGKPDRILETAREKGRVEDEGWRVRKDGSRFWALVVITALHDEDGELIGFAKVTRDLTQRRKSEEQARELVAEQAAHAEARRFTMELERTNKLLEQQTAEAQAATDNAQDLAMELEQANQQLEETLVETEEAKETAQAAERLTRFLVQVGDTLGTSLDYQANLQALARLVIPDLADWCSVDMVQDDGTLRHLAVAHVNRSKVSLAWDLREKYPPILNADRGVGHVLETGKPELYSAITDEMIEAEARDEGHLRILKALQLKSLMILPLVARGQTMGTMTLASAESGRTFTQRNVDFAMDVARRAAIAVDNARLHEEALAARRAAEDAAAAKTRFLAVMSHELRTPLNAIAGYAELIAMGVRGPVTPDQKRDLDRIVQNQGTLLALINDVLDYAKLESGRAQFSIERVNVREEAQAVEALVGPQLQAKQLRYDYEACAADATVCADNRSLRQILLNLLSNAIKFTPEGGQIRVSCSTDPEHATIAVSDTGIGIPADKLGGIFEPFVQLGREMSNPQQGSGLGLSISRDLARQMGGDLSVESEVGRGSTFTLTLPLEGC
jgi:PAS domain S-box-containing protein